MIIKKFENFSPGVLALPPHEEPEEKNKLVMTIQMLYDLERKDIEGTANRINSILNDGTYLRLRDKNSNIFLITQNEPLLLFGLKGGTELNKIGTDVVKLKPVDDSIIIKVKVDGSIFVISVRDNFEFIFIRPKIVVSHHDPYGEEDWGEE
jgi:hypothetical protein